MTGGSGPRAPSGRVKAPPRRSHKKSRAGCIQCKERRVKCDETRPQCTNCTYRLLHCSYLDNTQNYTTSGAVHSKSPSEELIDSQDEIQHDGDPQQTDTNHYTLEDLQLMHQFSTETYKSLCGDLSDKAGWQSLIPKLAYTNEFLMHGILALAALHMAATTTESNNPVSYLDVALRYNSLSFGPFRNALDNLTPQNCDAVYAYSAIITVIGVALPTLHGRFREERVSTVENMVTFFDLLQGATSISRISAPWLQASIFEKYSFWEMAVADIDIETGRALDQLDQLNQLDVDQDTEEQKINHEAIELLRTCFAKFVYSPHPVTIMAWLGYVQKEFISRLRLRRPVELLIFMHWGVLLDEFGAHFWWAEGSGKALVAEVVLELKTGIHDARWEEALEWPQRKVKIDES
ncbi:C6 transcription factor [Penicillium angulare]|uniref:C6 transcription factor n=1 Tax=Penicillium angulare TaxID=116970 RepID=UPI0025409DDB|nr:C6 transcription factor [Penicillium angulare]KAJ5287542.1 C6 transcription factor [Penicillium angulare]